MFLYPPLTGPPQDNRGNLYVFGRPWVPTDTLDFRDSTFLSLQMHDQFPCIVSANGLEGFFADGSWLTYKVFIKHTQHLPC